MSRLMLSMLFGFFLCSMIFAQPVLAVPWFGAEFSADIRMTNSKKGDDQAVGKLFVGKKSMRAEGRHQNRATVVLVHISPPEIQTLLPGKKEYYEGLQETPMPPMPDETVLPGDPDGPCHSDRKNISCRQTGQVTVNGHNTEKWEIHTSHRGEKMRTVLLWIDPALKVMIRQRMKNGPSLDRKLVGHEQVNGRDTEKWEVVERYQKQTRRSTRWVDRSLKAIVRLRSEGEGFFSAELTNIRVGPQPQSLFEIPSDYRKAVAPKKHRKSQQYR